MKLLERRLRELESELFFKQSIKLIDLEEVAEIYYRYVNNYVGYNERDICNKYFKFFISLSHIKTFETFVEIFKILNYRIM